MSDPTVQRLSEGYEPRFDIDKAMGDQGELFISEIVDGWNNKSVEVKTDERASQTGNLYFEYECCYSGAWRKTGIAASEAMYWAQVIGHRSCAIVVPTERLRDLVRVKWRDDPRSRREMMKGSHPTHGVVISIGDFIRWFNTPPESLPVRLAPVR